MNWQRVLDSLDEQRLERAIHKPSNKLRQRASRYANTLMLFGFSDPNIVSITAEEIAFRWKFTAGHDVLCRLKENGESRWEVLLDDRITITCWPVED